MEIIQPWQLYLILQADNISSVVENIAVFISWIAGIGTGIAGIASLFLCIELHVSDEVTNFWKKRWWLAPLIVTVVCASHIVAALIPSTKTLAIMFGVPAVINNPTFQQETGEVYQLLKKALSDTVQKKEQEKRE